MIRYKKPPRMDFSSCSMMTRKYEVKDISSKNTRNQNALSEQMTRFMDATKKFMKNPMTPMPLPRYSSKYVRP